MLRGPREPAVWNWGALCGDCGRSENLAALGEAWLSWKLACFCTAQRHGLSLWPWSVGFSNRTKTLRLMDWLPFLSLSSESRLPSMSMLGVIILEGTAELR